MNRINLILLLIAMACQKSEKPAENIGDTSSESRSYPASLTKSFDRLGGLERWKQMKTLSYSIEKKEGMEHHAIDLQSRRVRISADDYTIGFDGKDVWLAPDSTSFASNARFYHNLYFYFYALPYLAADPGLNYEDLGKAIVNGSTYDKVLITFNDHVGDSPEDEYVLYFNEEGLLELINYSVTYYDVSRAKKKYSAIKYEDWATVNGLLLPGRLVGFEWENDSLGDKRYERTFLDPELSEQQLPDSVFARPAGAHVSTKPSKRPES